MCKTLVVSMESDYYCDTTENKRAISCEANIWKFGQDSSVSSASDSSAKGGKFEPHCQQVDSAFHPSVGQ